MVDDTTLSDIYIITRFIISLQLHTHNTVLPKADAHGIDHISHPHRLGTTGIIAHRRAHGEGTMPIWQDDSETRQDRTVGELPGVEGGCSRQGMIYGDK